MRHAHRSVTEASLDNGLSEKGFFQCEVLRNYFAANNIKIQQVRSSPKLRCLQTAEFVSKLWNLPVQEDWSLLEAQAESSQNFTQRIIAMAEKCRFEKNNILLCTHADVLDVLLRWGDPSLRVMISEGDLLVWNPAENLWVPTQVQNHNL